MEWNGTTAVTGTVEYDSPNMKALFTPSANLAYATEYTSTVTTRVENTKGLAMSTIYVWTFTKNRKKSHSDWIERIQKTYFSKPSTK